MFCMFCIRIQDPESPYKDNSLYHSSHATYRHVLWIWSKPGGKPIKLSVLCRLIKTNQSQRKKKCLHATKYVNQANLYHYAL